MTQTATKFNKINNTSGMVLAPLPKAAQHRAPPPEAKTVIHSVQVPTEEVETLDLAAELAKLQAENAALKAGIARGGGMSLKVSEKGAVSVYGLGRFPVTLYPAQMVRFLERKEEILSFIEANKGKLSWEKVARSPEDKAQQEQEIEKRKADALKAAGVTVRRHAAR